MARFGWLIGAQVLVWFISGCGSSSNGTDLSRLAGSYEVWETFLRQSGAGCMPYTGGILENTVRVGIQSNDLTAEFTSRWGTLKGQIQQDGSFLISGKIGNEETINLSGTLGDETAPDGGARTTMLGQLQDIRPDCTRQFDVSGERKTP
jgi:hypothetical protein